MVPQVLISWLNYLTGNLTILVHTNILSVGHFSLEAIMYFIINQKQLGNIRAYLHTLVCSLDLRLSYMEFGMQTKK